MRGKIGETSYKRGVKAMEKKYDNQVDEKIIAAQNEAQQYNQMDTELEQSEEVQAAMEKSYEYEVKNQQPTYEPNKPF